MIHSHPAFSSKALRVETPASCQEANISSHAEAVICFEYSLKQDRERLTSILENLVNSLPEVTNHGSSFRLSRLFQARDGKLHP